VKQNALVIPIAALRRVLVVVAVLIVLLILALLARQQLSRAGIVTLFGPSALELLDANGYQAVFLTGGQVYFGRLQQQGAQYFVLYDVFYLSVPTEQNAQPQLIKRGSEIQAPVDPMIIPAGQVLYIENLRPDGQVATAIRRFKAGEIPTATAPPVTAPPSTARPSPSPTR
jgi:hypothetical protein